MTTASATVEKKTTIEETGLTVNLLPSPGPMPQAATALRWAASLCLAVAVGLPAGARAQDAHAVLRNAQQTLGELQSVRFSGSGVNGFFGQALLSGQPWPRRTLAAFSEAIDYARPAAQLELDFEQPVFGGQKQNFEVAGGRAWTVGPRGAVPQLAASEERQLQILMTPHGFVRAAIAAPDARVSTSKRQGRPITVISFTALTRFRLRGSLDEHGFVTQVETLFPNPVLGDMPYSYSYSDYRPVGGVQFPRHIVQAEGGFMVNDWRVADVQPNAAVDLPVPSNVQEATSPVVKVDTSPVAEGVWFLGGGSHHSVVVEFDQFLAVIEGPLDEARSLAVIAEAKRLAPNKPIKYVLMTHHHFDHSGGLRTYVAEGVAVVMHQSNRDYFQKSFLAPATLAPDEQSRLRRAPHIIGVSDQYVITDGKQTIEFYSTVGDQHSDELCIAYILPARVLVEADSFSPGPAGSPAPNPVPPNALVLYDNIQRLHLDPKTIIGIHGRGPASYQEFLQFVGKT